jgi:hypothetical protein
MPGVPPTTAVMAPPVVPSQQSSRAAAPELPSLNPADIGKAAQVIGSGVAQTLPKLGVPVDPRLITQGTRLLQTIISDLPVPKPAPAAAYAGNSSSEMQTTAPMVPQTFEVTPELLDALNQLNQATQYNLQMTQTGLQMASFGDQSMRLAAALEAKMPVKHDLLPSKSVRSCRF